MTARAEITPEMVASHSRFGSLSDEEVADRIAALKAKVVKGV